MPLVQISYTSRAPAFANIDNIEEKFRDHYGKIYTDAALYQKEVLEPEKTLGKFGTKVCEIKSTTEKVYDMHKICLNEEDFEDRQFYL